MEKDLVWISNHHLYYVIAKRNLVSAQGLQKEISKFNISDEEFDAEFIARTGRPDPDGKAVAIQRSVEMLENQDQHLTEAVIFAALAIEAFINFYAVKKSSKSYYDNYFDTLTVIQKWLLIPKIFNPGKGLDPGREPVQSLSNLVRARNSLVHAMPITRVRTDSKGKIYAEPLTKGRYGGSTIDEVEKYVETVKDLAMSLKGIDPTVNVDWINEERPERLQFNLP